MRAHLAAGLTKTGSEKHEWLLRRNMSVCEKIDLRVICVGMSVFASLHMCVFSEFVSHGGLCFAFWLSRLNIPVGHEKDSPCFFFFLWWPPAL